MVVGNHRKTRNFLLSKISCRTVGSSHKPTPRLNPTIENLATSDDGKSEGKRKYEIDKQDYGATSLYS